MQKEKPKFSVVCIMKNESKSLEKCATGLKEFLERGGEWFILDTGSTDGSTELARSLGATVVEVGEKFITTIDAEMAQKINDRFVVEGEEPIVKEGNRLFDFASSRNYATSLAKNDFILTLDIDEVYTNFNIDKINGWIDEGYTQFEYQFVFAHDGLGRPVIQFIQSKAFDRRKAHWEGVVHEVLQGPTKILRVGQEDIYLEHWQLPQGDHRSNYLVGLALDCYNNQKKDRQSHYLARELTWTKRPKSAIKEFERHIAMMAWGAERAQSMIFMGDCYGQLNQPDQQVKWYSMAYMTDTTRREALIKLAFFFQFHKLHWGVIAYTKAALEIPWTDYYANDKAMYEHTPHELLYRAYGWVGNIPEAQKHLIECLRWQPGNPIYLRDTQFYFKYPAPNVDGWMTFEELQYLYEMAGSHKCIGELGSWKGRSTNALATACKGIVYAIDTWNGSKELRDDTNWMAKQEDIFATFLKNTEQFTNIITNRKAGMEACHDYEDKSFDAVFIDAGHTYEEVKEDIDAWLPKARMILCGHDYQPDFWMGVVKAVDEKFGKPDEIHGSIWTKYLVPKVTFVIPTLGRPEGLKRCLDSIKDLNYPKAQIETIVIDGEGTVPQKMARGLWQSKGEYIVFASNDVEFTPDSLYNALQHDKGVVAFNTGDVSFDKGNICEHFIIKKDFVKKIGGEIFDTEFHHIGCDNLLYAKSNKLGEFERADDAIVYHYHWSKVSDKPTDEVYAKGWAHVQEDRELLAKKLAELQ
jgi:glycosyltransferase involved in cell wall biosynthesis